MEDNTLKFNKQIFDLSRLKVGLQKKDLVKNGNDFGLSLLFDFYDQKNSVGLKNNLLDKD